MNINTRIQNEIDAAYDAAHAQAAEAFERDITQRLDVLAREIMARRPDLEPASLDEWIINHAGRLTETERHEAMAVVIAYMPA